MVAAIEAKSVGVILGGRTVLHGVDFAAEAGEMVGLIGPNGAGKTTLLRALAGLVAAEEGTIAISGQPADSLERGARARAVAYLAQDGAAHWDIGVADTVMLGRLPHLDRWGGPNVADRAAVARAMAAADVAHLAHRRIGALSGGERTRVMLARALAAEPSVLLADEPVAGLDPAHRLDVMEALSAHARSGMTVVVVLHDLSTALRFCQRLMLLDDGTKIADGAPAEVLTEANLARSYGIRAHYGEVDGLPFLVPLNRVARQAALPLDQVARQAALPLDQVARQAALPLDQVARQAALPMDRVARKTSP